MVSCPQRIPNLECGLWTVDCGLRTGKNPALRVRIPLPSPSLPSTKTEANRCGGRKPGRRIIASHNDGGHSGLKPGTGILIASDQGHSPWSCRCQRGTPLWMVRAVTTNTSTSVWSNLSACQGLAESLITLFHLPDFCRFF